MTMTDATSKEGRGGEAAGLAPAHEYLLFAADPVPPRAASANFWRSFDSEDEAHRAFVRLRRDDALPRGCA
jgi:hypothetical protein